MAKNRAGSQRRQQKAQERRKRRARERVRPNADGRGNFAGDLGTIDTWWRSAILFSRTGGDETCSQFVGRLVSAQVDRVDATISDDFAHVLPALWEGGWQPRELTHVVRKHLQKTHEDLAMVLIVEQSHRYRQEVRDPQWLAQLESLRQATGWPELPAGPGLIGRFGSRRGYDRTTQIHVAVELRVLVESLPALPLLAPYPGDRSTAAESHSGLPAKLLEKVHSLLRKAETTEYPAEAEALSAKAQELVGRYGIQSILDSLQAGEVREKPMARRILIDDPHADGRALLLQQIAEANRCRTMWIKDLGMSTVFGFAVDVDFVELLHASLLVQATRAMTAHGSVTDHTGARRTASFRKSFLVSYAGRIGERLADKMRGAEAGAADDRLLPVLRSRAEDVDTFVTATFGETTSSHRINTSHSGGAAAGFAAANAADLSLFDELESA